MGFSTSCTIYIYIYITYSYIIKFQYILDINNYIICTQCTPCIDHIMYLNNEIIKLLVNKHIFNKDI